MKSNRSKILTLLSVLLIITALVSITGCVTTIWNPDSMTILTSPPMRGSTVLSSPGVETIYSSDDEILIFANWGQVSKSENNVLKWELVNNLNEILFSASDGNITLNPYWSFFHSIKLNDNLKKNLKPGEYTVNLYTNDQLSLSEKIAYIDKSIINESNKKVVILPFDDYSFSNDMDPNHMEIFLNTAAHTLYRESKRILPRTIPHFAAIQELEKPVKSNCLEKPDMIRNLKDIFGSDTIFISGFISLAMYNRDRNRIQVNLLNASSDEFIKYEFGITPRASNNLYYYSVIRELIRGVMYQKGLLEYLKTCS